jgi:hypothetical protein
MTERKFRMTERKLRMTERKFRMTENKVRRCPEQGEGMTERKFRMKIIMLPLGKAEGFLSLD